MYVMQHGLMTCFGAGVRSRDERLRHSTACAIAHDTPGEHACDPGVGRQKRNDIDSTGGCHRTGRYVVDGYRFSHGGDRRRDTTVCRGVGCGDGDIVIGARW